MGHFVDRSAFTKMKDIIPSTHFDFFVHLLQTVLNQDDLPLALMVDYPRAAKIKDEFFDKLHEYLLYENLSPHTFVLAYGGYENIDNLLVETRSWYDQRLQHDVAWYGPPKVIMNHRMLLYRRYNEYHCNEFEFPVLFLMSALCNTVTQRHYFSRSIGAKSDLGKYFDIPNILGDSHPKFHSSYRKWSMPMIVVQQGKSK